MKASDRVLDQIQILLEIFTNNSGSTLTLLFHNQTSFLIRRRKHGDEFRALFLEVAPNISTQVRGCLRCTL